MTKLITTLAHLENAQLVHRADEAEYIFKHALTQETAYESLLKTIRHEIHSNVARTYEELYADRLDEFAAPLAQHYAQAGDDEQAFYYATSAGDAAARVYANAEAITFYSQALDAAKRSNPAPAQVTSLFIKRGRALELAGRYPEAQANYEEMESMADTSQNPALALASLIARATLYSTHTPLYDTTRSQELSAAALALARRIGDQKAEAKILWTQMLFHIYSSGDTQAGVALGEQSLKILRELSAQSALAQDRAVREQLAYTLNDLFYAYIQQSRLDLGMASRQEARDLWRELDNQPMLADNLAGLALAQLTFGEAEQAIAISDEAYHVAESISNPWSMAQGRAINGYALAELGRFAEAFAALTQGDEYATAAETGGAILASRCGLAAQYLTVGCIARGLERGQRALEGAKKYISDWHLWPHAVLIRLHLARGDLATAQRLADESQIESSQRKLFRAFMPGVATVFLAEAELALAKKEYARVLVVADDAFEYFSGSAPNYLPDLLLMRAQALRAMGEREQAALAMKHARTALKKSRRVRWLVFSVSREIERANGNVAEADHWRDEARAEIRFIADNLTAESRESFLALSIVRTVLASN